MPMGSGVRMGGDPATRECYPVVPACHPAPRTYRACMSPQTTVPSPRDGLDTGSLAELCTDSTEVEVAVSAPRPWADAHHDIVVPDDASDLIEGLSAYGS